jgi:hypothetical protein
VSKKKEIFEFMFSNSKLEAAVIIICIIVVAVVFISTLRIAWF